MTARGYRRTKPPPSGGGTRGPQLPRPDEPEDARRVCCARLLASLRFLHRGEPRGQRRGVLCDRRGRRGSVLRPRRRPGRPRAPAPSRHPVRARRRGVPDRPLRRAPDRAPPRPPVPRPAAGRGAATGVETARPGTAVDRPGRTPDGGNAGERRRPTTATGPYRLMAATVRRSGARTPSVDPPMAAGRPI